MLTRRHLALVGIGGALVAAARLSSTRAAPAAPAQGFAVTHSDEEWRRLLTPERDAVPRPSGTYPPFNSPLTLEKRAGTFACAGCDQPLFSSKTKFDSGTGWPSFWAPLDDAVDTTQDKSFGMARNAVHCHSCGGHVGHVVTDGPKPTGLRYCMNGVAMTFKPAAA